MTQQEMQYARMLELRRQQVYNAWYRRQVAPAGKALQQNPQPEEPVEQPLGENVQTADAEVLAKAFAAQQVKTVKLTGDATLSDSLKVEAGTEKTIDLAGHSLSFSSTATPSSSGLLTVANGATLTIDGDGVVDNSGPNSKNASCAIIVGAAGGDADKPAKLTINGGTFKGRDVVVAGNGTYPNTDLTINGGTFVNVNGDGSAAVYQPQAGKLKITGGKFEGDCAVYVKSGEVEITGGEFKATQATKADYQYASSGFNTTGDAVIVDSCGYPGGNPKVAVDGGSFEVAAKGAFPIGSYAHGKSNEVLAGFVSGGTSNVEFDRATIAEGYAQTADGGKYVVAVVPATDPVETETDSEAETPSDSDAGKTDVETAE